MKCEYFKPSMWLAGLTTEEIILLFKTTQETSHTKKLQNSISKSFKHSTEHKVIYHVKHTSFDEGQLADTLKNYHQLDYSVLDSKWLKNIELSFQPKQKSNEMLEKYNLGIASVFKPILNFNLNRMELLLGKIHIHHNEWDFKQAIQMLLPRLIDRVKLVAEKTILLEFEIFKLNNEVKGKNEKEYFNEYLKILNTQNFQLSLLSEYQVLTRKTNNIINDWMTYVLDFLTRLNEDYLLIKEQFNFRKSSKSLKEIQYLNDDSTKSCSDVLLITFKLGQRVIYKPKSLDLERSFFDVLTWYNKFNRQKLNIITVVSKKNYGWMEYVPQQNKDYQLEIFAKQIGALLVFLYILQASDIHFQNLVTHNSSPVIIDLESLFQPNIVNLNNGKATLDSLGILPNFEFNQEQAVDNFGLGAAVSIVNKLMRLNLLNKPAKNSIEILNKMSALITSEFSETYTLVAKNKEELLTLLSKFKRLRTRYIHRNHSTYYTLMENANHPDNLRCGLTQDNSFFALWSGYLQRNYLFYISTHEFYALRKNKFPHFYTEVGSSALLIENGEVKGDFFNTCPFEISKYTVQNLNADNLKALNSEIHSSFIELTNHTKVNLFNQSLSFT